MTNGGQHPSHVKPGLWAKRQLQPKWMNEQLVEYVRADKAHLRGLSSQRAAHDDDDRLAIK